MSNTGKPTQQLFATIGWSAAASTTTIGYLPPNAVMSDIKVDVQTVFDSVTSDVFTIGHGAFGSTSADVDEFEASIDVKTAGGRIALTLLQGGAVISATESVPITVTYTPTGGSTSAGSATVIFEYTQQ